MKGTGKDIFLSILQSTNHFSSKEHCHILSSMMYNPIVPISTFRSAWKCLRKSVIPAQFYFLRFCRFLLYNHKVTVHRGPKLVSVWPRPAGSAQETHETFSRDPTLKTASLLLSTIPSIPALLRTFYQPWNLKRTKTVVEREETRAALTSLCEPQSYDYPPFRRCQALKTGLWRGRDKIIAFRDFIRARQRTNVNGTWAAADQISFLILNHACVPSRFF